MTGTAPQKAADFNATATEATTPAPVAQTAKATLGGDAKASASKAAGAFRTISEVADELGVQQHVLRFWETKFTQVKPLKRGGGRRYYRPEDVVLLKHIHNLLYTEGYTIKGVQKLLKGQGRAQIAAELTGAAEKVAPAAKVSAPANEAVRPEAKVVAQSVAAPVAQQTVGRPVPPMTDKQRAILEAMLGDLRDLRDLIRPEGKGE
ncbi:MerR family transcriptional regulator [Micavibrio aeruginosavorus]|uniref:MerR regulatory family protein n=1 Tax=Micavibrio aeruginosavorus (strain ARL-13) TaxID=856793 RepID=G2KLV3_MICAA|nr:MerR family transcriptional regulator [Micavibrio aeruginosavorus]AEP09332.1 merR regulatory family protein [Micavibrio aeruginosavorus ARL-13]